MAKVGFDDFVLASRICSRVGIFRWISSETGRRQDVPHHFIYNKNHKNITLTTGHLVKRVIFE